MTDDAYLIEHIREGLALDPRTNELNVDVVVRAGTVFLHGTLPTEERREIVAVVVSELAPDLKVCNETIVASLTQPPQIETLQ